MPCHVVLMVTQHQKSLLSDPVLQRNRTSRRTSFCQLHCINISVFSPRVLSGLSDVFQAPDQCFSAVEMYKGGVNLETEICEVFF